ncbi:MAG: BolA/IbaG family iron-sulfur metabolism protein [Gammaproteobacteria bacterium]|nr:BolA/IbaG family iron-sulfur metabolism protein [Gammaproteobacteria bacterium]
MEPVSNQVIEHALKQQLPEAAIYVSGDGYKYETVVVSEHFAGKNTLQRHKQIYAVLNTYINSGQLHALTIKTYTPEEFQNTPYATLPRS